MKLLRLRRRPLLAVGLLLGALRGGGMTTVEVDLGRVQKLGVSPVGLNLCWLLDSERLRPSGESTSDALTELHPGALRFPYGHLADNYLWHTPSGEVPSGPLHPKVASLKEPPSGWSWAVKADGTMPDAMDFDEFLRVCAKVGAKPVVCVNALSYKYQGGPTYEALKASAVAWVRYAARQSVHVAYWEIGNEVDLKPNASRVSLEEYVQLYADFAGAMKAADPTARIGPGIDNKPAYYRALMEKCPALVDYAVVHQYQWAQKQGATYEGWRDDTGTYIRNLEGATRALAAPRRPAVKLMVTETGVSGGAALGESANTYKALWLGELLLNELADPVVDYPLFWGTHTPWEFRGFTEEPKRDVAVALQMRNNARTPMGEVIKLINDHVLTNFLELPRAVGRLRTYAMSSGKGDQAAIFVLNKDLQPEAVEIVLRAPRSLQVGDCRELAGQTPIDPALVARARSLPPMQGDRLRVTVPPLSLTVMSFRSVPSIP